MLDSGTKADSVVIPPCIYCLSQGHEECHCLSKCANYLCLSPAERKEVVVKSGRCLNCLRKHFVKDCGYPNNCRKCGISCSKKHYYLLHDLYATKCDSRSDFMTKPSEARNCTPVRNVSIGTVKAALNRVTAVRVVNPANGKSRLIYCQHDPGSQLTFVSSNLVSELDLDPFDNVSFEMNTMIGKKNNTADLVKFNIQSLETDELFVMLCL